MILIKGSYKDIGLTGTVFEPDDEVPYYKGAPVVNSQYTWICDSFYEVSEGGTKQQIEGEEHSVAFERPTPKGFTSKEEAIKGGKNHIKTQFKRIDSSDADVSFEIITDPSN